MRKIIFHGILLILFLAGCDTTNSIKNPNDTHFVKFYGDDGDQTGVDFIVLPDGSFVLFGTTRPSGTDMTSQWYLVKADANGNVLWTKTYGGPNDDEARDIELTNDNRLVLVGNTYITNANRDVKIMTVTLDGVGLDSAVVPIYTSGGVDSGADEDAASVTQTSDGFIVSGSTTDKEDPNDIGPRDGLIMRFNNDLTNYILNGWPIRQARGFKPTDEVTKKIYQLSDGTFVVFGYSNKPAPTQTVNNYNFWYFNLGLSGDPAGVYKHLGDQPEDEKLCSAIAVPVQSSDGYFLAGLTTNSTGTTDMKISKLKKTIDFSVEATDELYKTSLQIRLGSSLPEIASGFATTNSTYYVLSNENGTDNQNWILTKGTIIDGIKIWALPIVFGGEGLDTSGSVQELADGSVVLIGTMRTGKPDVGEFKMTLIKVNKDGKLTE